MAKRHLFKHFVLITKHRHRVIKNASHMGIFWHSLGHDLSKYGCLEFFTSAKYYAGDHSPVIYRRRPGAAGEESDHHQANADGFGMRKH